MLRWGLQVLVGELLPLLLEKAANGAPSMFVPVCSVRKSVPFSEQR